MRKLNLWIAVLVSMCTIGAFAGETEGDLFSRITSLDGNLPLKLGPVEVGGAVRFQYDYRDYDSYNKNRDGDWDWDCFRLRLKLDAGDVFGAAQYRWKNIDNDGASYSFLDFAWLGYHVDECTDVKIGVTKVPFGILPYASASFWYNIGYYVGLEDDYDLGATFTRKWDDWRLDLGYFVSDEGSFQERGSEDSARYSYDVVKSGDQQNEERNQVNARLAHTYQHAENWTSEMGLSLQAGQIHNDTTDDDGYMYAGCLHLKSDYKRFGVRCEVIRYDYDLRNPHGQDQSEITVGAYDWEHTFVSKGWIFTSTVCYTVPVNWGPITALTFYDDYGLLVKDESDFSDSQQNAVGVSFAAGNFFTYVELISGRNNPYTGSGNDGFGKAGGDHEWNSRFLVNVGYYF